MNPVLRFEEPRATADAYDQQRLLRRRLRSQPLSRRTVSRVAGCDVAIQGERLIAAVVVLSFPDLNIVEKAHASTRATLPYIPGLLSFRELPVLLRAFGRIRRAPDVIVCDGQGRAHPREFGLACHLGVLLDRPTVGCAKSRLCGQHDEPGPRRGDFTPLVLNERTVGRVLRTRDGIRPVFISSGHRMRLVDAMWITLRCGRGYRLPEPTRLADQLAGRLKR